MESQQTRSRDAVIVSAIGDQLRWQWTLEVSRSTRLTDGLGDGVLVTASVPVHLQIFVPDAVPDERAPGFARSVVSQQLEELARELSP